MTDQLKGQVTDSVQQSVPEQPDTPTNLSPNLPTNLPPNLPANLPPNLPTNLPPDVSQLSPDVLHNLLTLVPGLPVDLTGLIDLSKVGDLVAQPLSILHTCGPKGPQWKLKNISDKTYGFGWFDTKRKGDTGQIPPGGVITLVSSAVDAILATPFDLVTGNLLKAIPAIGVAECPGTPTPATEATDTGTATVPVSTPADAVVTDKVYYTG
ncbi:hypothetical protein [Protofrankia symbiont of Coriaria ruscifolia]|uniref:hypothetical protein n=1 Tax=Protofrankia symbiont of Coriaria ruscifolia TaxID=1306542 RepID=UPI0010415F42|nr:hypothetical protein [Protofrankia symbiont of Coriaria ruscifolia]